MEQLCTSVDTLTRAVGNATGGLALSPGTQLMRRLDGGAGPVSTAFSRNARLCVLTFLPRRSRPREVVLSNHRVTRRWTAAYARSGPDPTI
jgi:hypothetical protein